MRALRAGSMWLLAALGACGTPCDDAWISDEGCPSACYVLTARAVEDRGCTVEEETTICTRSDELPTLGAECIVDEQTGTWYWAQGGVSLGAGWRACTPEEAAKVGPDDECAE